MRKFRRRAEAAVTGIEARLEAPHRRLDRRGAELGMMRRRAWLHVRERRDERGVLLADLLAALAVELRHALEQLRKSRQVMARLLGKISPAEKGRAVGRQEHGERPAARALRDHLVRKLIDLVEVRTLFAVHLDVDEQPVHHRGDGGVLERLVRHDMAPVAGGVADRQQDRPVLGARARALRRPRDTSRRDCPCAAAGRGWFPRTNGWACAAGYKRSYNGVAGCERRPV